MVAVDLRRKLQDEQCGESGDVRAHFDKLSDMFERLSSMGMTLTDDEYATILLGSLPGSYDPIITSMTTTMALEKREISPETIMHIAIDEYDRRLVKN